MKARALWITLIALVMVLDATGQLVPDTLWTRSYGGEGDDWANVVKARETAGYLVAGVTHFSGGNDADMYLLFIDDDGGVEQERAYGTEADDEAYDLIQMADGGISLLGRSGRDGYVVRLDADGDTLWTRLYNNEQDDQWEWAVSGYEDEDGNVVVLYSSSGHFMTADRNSSVQVIVYSDDGEYINETGYDSPAWTRSIALDADRYPEGGFLIAGQRWADPPDIGTPPFYYGFIGRTESEIELSNDFAWNRVSFIRSIGEMSYMALMSDWYFRVARGEMDSGESWGTIVPNTPSSICAGTFRGYVVTGSSYVSQRTDVDILKLDSTGTFMWSKQFGGADFDEGADILMTEDDCYVIVGYTKSFGAGGRDIYIIKTGQDTSTVTSVSRSLVMPETITLTQNHPNPFNPETEIEYQIASPSSTTLKVFDVLGKEVATLVNEVKSAGNYIVQFDGLGLPSGVYIYRLQAGRVFAEPEDGVVEVNLNKIGIPDNLLPKTTADFRNDSV